MVHCCHIWAGADQSSLSSHVSIQRRLCGLEMDDIFHYVNSLPQTKRNCHGKCEDGLHSLAFPGQTFQARTGHLTPRNSNKLH